MAKIDYLTISLGRDNYRRLILTSDVLYEFAVILPELYKSTCREMMSSGGETERVWQYGVTVSKQYGTAQDRGWEYSVSLSGDYWHAIDRNHAAVLEVLSQFEMWRISRLDLACDVCVPLEEWREYYTAAFLAGDYTLNGKEDARTVYYGSRKSQFFTRIYNKTAEDGKHYPAPDGFIQARFEIEVKRVRGDLVLDYAFDTELTNRLFLQRVLRIAECDTSGFIEKYFATADTGAKIQTVRRTLGNLENTVDYVFKYYEQYISAGLHSQMVADRYKNIVNLNDKGMKVLAVLDSEVSE